MEPVSQKTHRPAETPFWQQNLRGWNPVYNAGFAVVPFLVAGCIFVPTGLVVFFTTKSLQEYQFDYTDCKQLNGNSTCASVIAEDPLKPCLCVETLQLPEDFLQTVHVYYGLTNVFQNYRLYVQSRDDWQLLGYMRPGKSLCKPFHEDRETGLPIFPCGAVANSLFNDTFLLRYMTSPASFINVPVDTDDNVSALAKPRNWPEPVTLLPNGLLNEAFIVWMRTAALPWLRKLYGRVESTGDFTNVLPKGEYQLEIHYRYPVAIFEGTKRFILSNASWMGSRNPFIAIAYFFTGILSLALGVSFKVIHKKFGSIEYPMPEVSDFWEKPKPVKGRKASMHPRAKTRRGSAGAKKDSDMSQSE
ncbi:cell cycle control protein 50A-like [Haemaphysalis longicornis]